MMPVSLGLSPWAICMTSAGGEGAGVAVEGENDAGVLGALAVGDLHDVGGEEVGVAAQLGDAGLEGIARARGLVEENQENGLVGKIAMGLAATEAPLQVLGDLEQGLDLRLAPLLRGNP